MDEQYANYVVNRTDFWRKAKQIEYNSIDKIVLSLEDCESLTSRNAITLRLLGLVYIESSNNIKLTSVGEEFLNNPGKRQVILDEQLLKLYLDSYVNTRMKIAVFPLAIIFEILQDISFLTFEEYKLFVCWVNRREDIREVVDFIKYYRSGEASNRSLFKSILLRKSNKMGIQDFEDNIHRLFAMLKLSSFLDYQQTGPRYSEVLISNNDPSVYSELTKSVYGLSGKDYENEVDQVYLGLVPKVSQQKVIVHAIQELGNEERRVLQKDIAERNSLPDISDVEPERVDLKVLPQDGTPIVSHLKGTAKKIDYVARDTKNRLVGLFGERIVYKYEYSRLQSQGHGELALKIEHVSLTDDSLGYDIKSYRTDGTKMHIEVKTVSNMMKTFSFYISKNELDTLENDDHHTIYLVYNYRSKSPKVWELPNILKENDSDLVKITPTQYKVTVKVSTVV